MHPTAMEYFLAALQFCENRTSPGTDAVNFEFIKYAPALLLHDRLLNFINLSWTTGHIRENWQMAKVVPIFMKGDHNDCDTGTYIRRGGHPA